MLHQHLHSLIVSLVVWLEISSPKRDQEVFVPSKAWLASDLCCSGRDHACWQLENKNVRWMNCIWPSRMLDVMVRLWGCMVLKNNMVRARLDKEGYIDKLCSSPLLGGGKRNWNWTDSFIQPLGMRFWNHCISQAWAQQHLQLVLSSCNWTNFAKADQDNTFIVSKEPPVGFEPTTSRLLSGCSAN